MNTTETHMVELTDCGIDLGDRYHDVVDDYLSYDISVVHEDDEVIIFMDTSRHDIGEWSHTLSESWDDVNSVMHDVAYTRVDDAHLVFSAVDPIVFSKPGGGV